LPKIGVGADDIGIDTDSATLYVTYESSNTISKFSSDFVDMGSVTVGTSNLAGIEVDQENELIYAMAQGTDDLYIYDLNFNPVGTPNKIYLGNGVNSAYGIALDEIHDWLFVAGDEQKVRYFNTADWSLAGSFDVNHHAIGIAVDAENGYVYTGAACAKNNELIKYDMGTSSQTSVTVGSKIGAMGVAVDPKTNLVYIDTGWSYDHNGADYIKIYDSDLNEVHTPAFTIGNRAAGLCISGKDVPPPTKLTLTKVDDVSIYVVQGSAVTYTISYENKNTYDVTGVTIKDTLPSEVTYQSCTGGGSLAGNIVTWNIDTVGAGASGSVMLTVLVKMDTPGGTVFTNWATIDSTETPPTTVSEDTMVRSGAGPTVESADISGTPQNLFRIGDPVDAVGSGYPAASTTYDLYVVDDIIWTDGMAIPSRVAGTVTSVTTDASKNIPSGTLIWNLAAEGNYDLVVDVNGNGQYDVGTDAIDRDIDVGFEAIPEFTTIAIPAAMILGMVFLMHRRKREE
jgi:uncharacterized repeat protein (TIGR01451 family)